MKRKAFTLIELLVVISIIALLLSIMVPSLQKAKQHALRMLCQTNLHNYGIATNIYLMEHNDQFPNPWAALYSQMNPYSFENADRYCRWHNGRVNLTENPEVQGPLWPYLEAEEVNLCPVFAKLGKKFGYLHPLESGGVREDHINKTPIEPQFGYSMNSYLNGTPPNWADMKKMSVTKSSMVKSPATTFVWGEENMWAMQPGSPGYDNKPYPFKLSTAVLNDTALVPRTVLDDPESVADAFGTFHSAPAGNYNKGTSNAVMMDGSINQVTPFNDMTFSMAYPKLGAKLRKDPR